MGIYLNPGNEDFQQALNSEIYVDKSMLIEHTNRVLRTKQKYICVSRPRRFGKTMTLEMISAYYSRGCDSREQFQGLKIAGTPDFEKHLNKYHVIRLNTIEYMSEAQTTEEMIRLIEEDLIDELEQEFPDMHIPKRRTLVKCLESVYMQYQVSFVFLIDEYDCILRMHLHDTEAQRLYLDFLCYLLKDRGYVALAYVTGILPVKKYANHSSVDFTEISMLHVREFAEVTGFTKDEVAALCEKYNMSFEEARNWYEGYQLEDVTIYNPQTVVEAILRGRYGNYWARIETHDSLRVYLEANQKGLRTKVMQLLASGRVAVNPLKFQNDMITFRSADDILTLLVHLGYLTFDFDTKQVWIPNREVRQEYANSIEDGGMGTGLRV